MFQVVDAGCSCLCRHLLCHNSVPVVHVAFANGGRLLLTEGHHAPNVIVGLCCMYGIALAYSVHMFSAGWQCKLTVLHDVARWAMQLLPTCKWCTHRHESGCMSQLNKRPTPSGCRKDTSCTMPYYATITCNRQRRLPIAVATRLQHMSTQCCSWHMHVHVRCTKGCQHQNKLQHRKVVGTKQNM